MLELERTEGVPALLQATCRELVGMLDASGCVLSRVIGELLICIARDVRRAGSLDLGRGYLLEDFPLTRRVIEQQEVLGVSALDPDADRAEVALLRELGFDSLLMLPLCTAEGCWGIVEVYRDGGRTFGDEDVEAAGFVVARASELLARLS